MLLSGCVTTYTIDCLRKKYQGEDIEMKKIFALVLVALLISAFTIPAAAAPADDGYVTDGLEAFYSADGVAAGSATWEDLSGNGNDITNVPATDSCKFTGDAYLNTATKVMLPTAVKDVLLGSEWTTELALGDVEVTGTTWGTLLNSSNDYYALFYRGSDLMLEFKNGGNTRPNVALASYNDLDDATITVTFKAGEACIIYINGEKVAEVVPTAAITPDDLYFGHDAAEKSHTTEYKGIRVYSRALTADEVASNYAADNPSGSGDESTGEGNPDTGDELIIFVAIALVSLAGVGIVIKIRK